jgi:lipopolysaccharide transport system ATP-binding protein
VSNDLAIRVESLGKMYRIGAKRERYKTFRDTVAGLFGRNGSERPAKIEPFWALKDLSFEVKKGEVVGVIGRNGAGKSTLLKILSRITEPTEGFAEIRGRVGSLLEVGTGFHPELTGRENIFLNGAVLGMKRSEIERTFDEIVAFAEVEHFIDTPVKHYSSGMYLRLAFAIAAHLEPDILIVDEVLAVGDAEFQKKCLGKMKDVAGQGRTVLFVSHNMQAVSTLTTRCLILDSGRFSYTGDTQQGIAHYLQTLQTTELVFRRKPSNVAPEITYTEVQTSEPGNTQRHGMPLQIVFEVNTPEPIKAGAFSFQIVDSLLQPIVHLWIFDAEQPLFRKQGTHRLTCTIPNLRLYMGQYTLTAHLAEGNGGRHFQSLEGVCPFRVVMHGRQRSWRWQEGACRYLEEGTWVVEA